MRPAPERGRLLFLATVAAVVVERLVIAGVVLFGPQFTWTNFLMPVTHIAVVIFLAYTADILIYWLVILWGLVTSGTFLYNLWGEYQKLATAEQKAQFWTAPTVLAILGLAAFHLVVVLLLLTPPIRAHLAKQRRNLDSFEDPPTPAAPETDESRYKV
jgi:hypothetical protein